MLDDIEPEENVIEFEISEIDNEAVEINMDSKTGLEIQTTTIESKTRNLNGIENRNSNMVIDVDVNCFSIGINTPRISNIRKSFEDTVEGNFKNYHHVLEAKVERRNHNEIAVNPSFLEDTAKMSMQDYDFMKTSFITPNLRTIELFDDAEEINPKDLHVIKPVGSGSFGTVYLW